MTGKQMSDLGAGHPAGGESRAANSAAGAPTSRGGEDARLGDWGLYRAGYERDSCGFGLIASLDDQASHWLIETAISSLNRLTHRGAIAADGKTGDGCGLLIKMPLRFLRAAAVEAGFSLSPLFAAGLVFLDRETAKADNARRVLTEQIEREGLERRRQLELKSDEEVEAVVALFRNIEMSSAAVNATRHPRFQRIHLRVAVQWPSSPPAAHGS